MIRKPAGAERETAAHAAVGRAIDVGGEVRDASRRGGQLLGKGCLLYLALGMGFGLLTSSTPIWFKAVVLALGYGGYRLMKAVGLRAQG